MLLQSNLHLWPPFFIAVVSPFFSLFSVIFFNLFWWCCKLNGRRSILYSQKWCHTSFLFCNCLLSSNMWFSNNHFHLFIRSLTSLFIYELTKKNPSVTGSHPMRGWLFFSGVLSPNCLFLWHSILHNYLNAHADVIRCCILCEQPRTFYNYLVSGSGHLTCSWLSHQATLIFCFKQTSLRIKKMLTQIRMKFKQRLDFFQHLLNWVSTF